MTVDIPKELVAINAGMISLMLETAAQTDPSHTLFAMPGDSGALEKLPPEDIQDLYFKRNASVLMALGFAATAGIPCGIRVIPGEPDWPIVYIDLPEVGQVSWHLPAYTGEYDGHDTAEKYDRVRRFDVVAQRMAAGAVSSRTAGHPYPEPETDNG
jgi:hypothetical protein